MARTLPLALPPWTRPGLRRAGPRLAATLALGAAALLGSSLLGGCSGTRRGIPPRAAEPVPCVGTPAGGLAEDVLRLRSADFVERSRAAERLVEAGEAALPVLGAAGDATVRVPGACSVSSTRPVVDAILEGLSYERVLANLDAPWPAVRAAAAAELGERPGWAAVPRLIDGTEDDDTEVRAAAVSSLRRLTNRFFGFEPRGRLVARRAATERWRRWWRIEGRLRTASAAGGSG